MSKKTTTSTTASYDPTSMAFFQNLTPQLQRNLTADLQLDPTKSPVFNLALQWANRGVQSANQRMINSVMANMNLFGSGNNMNMAQQSLLARTGRATSANQSNAFLQNYINYDTLRRQETMNSLNYKPLQTGETTTQKTSGGWLGSALGAAVSIGLAPFTGGASLLGLPAAAGKGFGGASTNPVLLNREGDGLQSAMNIPNLDPSTAMNALNMQLPSSYFNNYTRL